MHSEMVALIYVAASGSGSGTGYSDLDGGLALDADVTDPVAAVEVGLYLLGVQMGWRGWRWRWRWKADVVFLREARYLLIFAVISHLDRFLIESLSRLVS
jgi:hypothetical protein